MVAGLARRLRPSPQQLRVFKGLAPYVWPSDRPDLQRTVVVRSSGRIAVSHILLAVVNCFHNELQG